MFLSESKLPYLLSSASYSDAKHYRRERDEVFLDSWHLVATTDELLKAGDFVTRVVAGVPVQVRNFDGEIRALSNVCAHRHSLICGKASGNSSTMKCQYHGWEYQADGCTGKIPEPKNFVPFEKGELRLPNYAIETVGQLVFINVAADPTPIEQQFGDALLERLKFHFGDGWSLALRQDNDFPVNWKIPVEIALESYHVPAVHSKTFREDPGSERSHHELHHEYTSLQTKLPFATQHWLDSRFQRYEGFYLKWQGVVPSQSYEHIHVLPNLLISLTDAVSLIQFVSPIASEQCTVFSRQFGRLPIDKGPLHKSVSWFWNQLNAKLTQRILVEDQQLYEQIQAGLNGSSNVGVLGICEERIYHFQKRLLERMGASAGDKGETVND